MLKIWATLCLYFIRGRDEIVCVKMTDALRAYCRGYNFGCEISGWNLISGMDFKIAVCWTRQGSKNFSATILFAVEQRKCHWKSQGWWRKKKLTYSTPFINIFVSSKYFCWHSSLCDIFLVYFLRLLHYFRLKALLKQRKTFWSASRTSAFSVLNIWFFFPSFLYIFLILGLENDYVFL